MSNKGNTLNMTEGNPFSLIIRFSIPMLIGNLFQQFYNLVDSIMVGRLVGADAFAAVGASSSITFFFFALCNGIGSGGGIITSQFFGGDDTRRVKKCISNTGFIMFVFPLVVGTIAFFLSGPLLKLLDTPAEIFHDALIYVRIMCIGIVFVSLYNYISSMLRALGDSKTPLYFLIFSCFLNIGLDAFCIAVLKMGVVGAAVATLIAQFIAGAGCFIFAIKTNPYFKMTREDLSFDWDITIKTVKLGIPLSLQFSLIAISSMALQRVVNSFGAVAVAAFTATSRVEQIIHQPYQTLSAALSTFCGQNYGANKNKRVIKGFHVSMIIMTVFTAIMLPIMQLGGKAIVSIFVTDAAVIDMGAKALQITSLFYITLGLIYMSRGVLNGLGDAFFALLNGVVEVLGRFIVPIAMTSIAAIGLWGIWWSVGIVWFVSGTTAWMRYRSYTKRKLGDSEPEENS